MIPDSPGAGSDLSGDGHIRPPSPPGRSTRAVSRVPAHSRPTNASQGGSRAPPRQGGVKKKRRPRSRAAPIPKGLPQRPQTRRPERPRSAFTAQLPQSGHAMPTVPQPLNTPIQSWSDRWPMGAPLKQILQGPSQVQRRRPIPQQLQIDKIKTRAHRAGHEAPGTAAAGGLPATRLDHPQGLIQRSPGTWCQSSSEPATRCERLRSPHCSR
jgi:hypothetical protein